MSSKNLINKKIIEYEKSNFFRKFTKIGKFYITKLQ